MALKYQKPRGTHDLYPGASDWADNSERTEWVESAFRSLARAWGYGEVRTPLFESTELFKRSVGEGTDIVNKEMYTFDDKSKRSLTLRPESTAPALRAYLENSLYAQGGTSKLFYVAQHFRYERSEKGRYRQHEQVGVEALGSDDPALDAEVIQLALAFFGRVGIPNLALKINSVGSAETRAAYLPALKEYVTPFLVEFSEEGQARYERNPLRLLDTKNARELEILADAPHLTDYLSQDEAQHFALLRGYLDDAKIKYQVDPSLVRGFDYYTRTAFEIQSPDLGAQNALGGGGRYNRLVEDLGGPLTPGIGFGLGVERILIALQALNVEMPALPGPMAWVVTLGDAARPVGVRLLSELRAASIAADTEYAARSIKAQMKAADRARARYAVIVGDDEVAQGVAQLKNLEAGWQHTVPLDEVVAWLGQTPIG